MSGLHLAQAVLSNQVSLNDAARMLDRVDKQRFFEEVVQHLARDRGTHAPAAWQSPTSRGNSSARLPDLWEREPEPDIEALYQDIGGEG
jgi:hypothetical protein